MTKEERLNHCLNWIQRITSDETELVTNRAEAQKYYFADKLGNEVEGRSQIVTSDLSDTVEWIMPSLMRIFCSGDDVCDLQPRGPEDTKAVELNQELANYQLRIRNPWYVVIHDFCKDSLLLKTGVIKYSWTKKEEEVSKSYTNLSEQELYALVQNEPQENIKSFTSNEDGSYSVTIAKKIYDEYPQIAAVPPDEVGFPKDMRDMESCHFLYHRVRLWPYEIAERYGEDKAKLLDDKTPKALDSLSDADTQVQERFKDLGGINFWFNEEDERYWVYECYFTEPRTGDHRKLVLCGDEVLEDITNDYKRPPFVVAPPIKLTHRVIGRSLYDLVKDLQRLRTVLFRQVLDNVYFSNYGRYIGDPDRFSADDLFNNNVPGGLVRGDKDALGLLPHQPLEPWAFNLIEFIQAEKEAKTGVTRYNQGINAQSLNKTAHGIEAILGQSQQRIELIARTLSEMAIAPLIREVIGMNIRYLTKTTAVRLLNEWIDLSPDNLVCSFDVIVNVGIGTGSKDKVIAQMQQLLGLDEQLFKVGVPILQPINVYNKFKELVKAMGYRNVDDFYTKPPVQPGPTVPGQPIPQPGMGAPQDPNAQVVNGGTMVGQTTPAGPQQPIQPGQPTTTPAGGGYYGP